MVKFEYPAGKMNFNLETKVVSADPRRGKLVYDGVKLTRITKKKSFDGYPGKKMIWISANGNTTVSQNKK